MNKEPLIFIEHILESIEKIKLYAENFTKAQLTKDAKIQDAIIRRIEVIGEAAKNLQNDFKNRDPEVKWSEIIRTRDKITHHYFGIDLDVVWGILKKDIPILEKQMFAIKEKLNKSPK